MSESKSNASPTLDGENLAMLLEEVIAMASSHRSLPLGLADIEDAAAGKLGRAARFVRTRIEQGHPPGEAIAALSADASQPIRAAMEVMAETGSTESIRETVRMIRTASQDRRNLLVAAINPAIQLVIGMAIVFFVMPWILVSIVDAELIRPAMAPTTMEISRTFTNNFVVATVAMLIAIGVITAIFYTVLMRSRRRSDSTRDHATFCRWLAIQIEGAGAGEGIAAQRLIQRAAGVVDPAFESAWSSVADRIGQGVRSTESLAMPTTTPEPVVQCVADLVGATRDRDSIAFDLRRLGDWYDQTSRRQRSWWGEVFPRVVIALVMIGIIVLITQTMLAPLVNLFSELL